MQSAYTCGICVVYIGLKNAVLTEVHCSPVGLVLDWHVIDYSFGVHRPPVCDRVFHIFVQLVYGFYVF